MRLLYCAGLLLALVAPPSAAGQAASDDRVKELIRLALEARQPTPAAPQSDTAVVAVDLGLDEAVKRALDRNLDIAVERLNPETYDLAIAALDSNYRPTLNSMFGTRSTVTLPTSQLTGGDRVSDNTVSYNTGLSQNFKWGGGALAFTFNNSRQDSSNLFAVRNPNYRSSIQAVFVQPLLRGFRTDATRSQLLITRLNQDISETQLRATVANTLSNVRNAYWDLLYTVQAVDVARRSLDLARKLIEDNQARVEVGTMAPIDVVQAEAEGATRRQTLAQAEANWHTAELALKQLIVGGTDDPLWRAPINPVDQPTFAPVPVDLEAAVRTALDRRTDLYQAKKQLESNDVSMRLLVNQILPALDLTATYGLAGLGGTQIRRSSGLGGQILDTIPGGYVDALRNIGHLDAPNWNLQLNLSFPIGQSAADANVARARIQTRQTQAQIRALELQVATEVTNAALQLESGLKRVEAATAARELAQKRLEAEQSKFEVGMSTNFFVVQAQRDLADAQIAELRALLDYRKAQVEFERVQETTSSRGGITAIAIGGGGASTATRTAVTTGGGGGGGGDR
jgi:outer membrane protein TolC